MLPQSFGRVNLAAHWAGDDEAGSFCDAVTPQGRICDAGLAPKMLTTPEFEAVANYAYHLDAGKLGAFLQRHCCETLGVRHILADVDEVNLTDQGDIASVAIGGERVVEGDLFIDCTGFSAKLLGGVMGVPFCPCDDVLFCDTALAVQVPYATPDDPIASHTISTAQSAGWIWDIGLPTRRGVGHVFSSNHISAETAERELRAYIGDEAGTLPIRKLPIRAGHRETFWKRNCVAVGLAAGFLEPLEASAIVLIELSAKMIADQIPACREVMDVVARRYNETTLYRWGRIIDFLKLHYALTKRTDSDFWRDNVRPETMPERLRELMTLWRYHAPWAHEEFDRVEEVFPAASYQYVLYGMGFHTEPAPGSTEGDADLAARAMHDNAVQSERMVRALPRHRDLINRSVERGLQPI